VREVNPGADFEVVSNPEFLREGAAISDFKRPDRIVIGTTDPRARALMTEIYRPLSLNKPPLFFVDRRTSEIIKYAANAFLATKVTFINEIADLCEKVGANVQDVARGIGMDNRIGSKFLHAGPGFGGSCFPKDTLALVKTGQDADAPIRIVETVAAINDQRKRGMAKKVIAACGGSVRGKTVGLLGLAFKPNTDDMRDAPSLALALALEDAGARLRVYDPAAMAQAKPHLGAAAFCADAYDCATGTEALVIVTEWDMFRALDFARLARLMSAKVLVDLRNVYSGDDVRRRGFAYIGVGVP
jgi:UDPglucose 6-dehydrogenase